jgi:hypothetical protein
MPAGGETVAVLLNVPVAEEERLATATYVTEAPTGRLTVSEMFPDPDGVQIPPPLPVQVHVAVKEAGNVSVTLAPTAGSGPALAATIV